MQEPNYLARMTLDVPHGYAPDLDPEDLGFQMLYGPWEPMSPAELNDLMAGFPAPWWVVGGHAIEAFTKVPRHHDDIDLTIFAEHLPALREHVAGRYHLWSAGAGALRPVDDRHPDPHPEAGQVWLREHALAPWRVDCILNPSSEGRWVSRRDETHVADLDDITWVADDGVRYLNPEVALLFKAKQARPKDDADLASAWPLLSAEKRRWLRDAVRRVHPDHPWIERLSAG